MMFTPGSFALARRFRVNPVPIGPSIIASLPLGCPAPRMELPGRTYDCDQSGTARFRQSLPPHTTPPPARATAALRVAEPADRLLCESTPESPALAVYDPSAEAAATSAPAACTSLFS